MIKEQWEVFSLDAATYRLKVVGGWLIRYDQYNNVVTHHDRDNNARTDTDQYIPVMVFVPDVGHTWDLDDLLKR